MSEPLPITPSAIVLAAINARYRHTSFGLRYLLANLGELADQATLVETQIKESAEAIVDLILAPKPRIVGLGVYVWNAVRALEVVRLLRTKAPELVIVLGGPEVSHEWGDQEIVSLANYTVTGEGEHAFRSLCEGVLQGEAPEPQILHGGSPALETIALPYDLYSDDDLAHRVIYVEASRGCPFRCQFCLSSLDRGVRMVPREDFFKAMQTLLDRGARDFKFIDRTFNLRIDDSVAILRFFLERLRPGLSLHFEMIPDRLPDSLRGLLAAFPPQTVQLELGIQSWSPEVGKLIERRQDPKKTEENLRFLAAETRVHVHADLIVGLPGEDLSTFAAGFDRLVALGPQEVQVGILKRLRGTPIAMHDTSHAMRYSASPPYEVRSTSTMSEEEIDAMKRFARFWDLIANSGNFRDSCQHILKAGDSAFTGFYTFSEALYAALGRTHHLALNTLAVALFEHLTEATEMTPEDAALLVAGDLHRTYGRKTPKDLKPHLPLGWRPPDVARVTGGLVRQARHAAH
ncbi:MAG: DUF4080 domain-containing protein [Myxococcota bacterium]